jgi:hypothetical protein
VNNTPKWLKWAILGGVVLAAGPFVIPTLVAMVWGTVQIVVGLMIAAGLCIAAPALAEWAAQGSYWLYANAIKTNPVVKLWREFKEFLEEIDKVQENINVIATEEESAKAELRKNREHFDAHEILEYEEQIGQIVEAKLFMMEERDRLKADAEQMRKDIKKNEAHWKMGNALVKAAKAVDKATGIAAGSDGGRIAIDTIQNRLAEGRARMNVLRSQRSADGIRKLMEERKKAMTIDGDVKEVKAAPALTNNASPVLQGLMVNNSVPVAPRQAPTSKLDAFLNS